MTVGIVGTGLIGGSIAIDLRRRGFADRLLGVEADKVNAAAALELGIVDAVVNLEECAAQADIVVVAVPVGTAVKLLPQILDMFASLPDGGRKVLMDACSTKSAVIEAVRNHPMRGRFVASHPMAGTEYSGPRAALSGMFDGRACVFADPQDSDTDALEIAEKLYDKLCMRVVRMSAADHDVHTAYVSHLSHVISFALALTVLEKEKDEKHIFDLASGGFSSTARLAKSGADMWVPILLQNRDNLRRVMHTYSAFLEDFDKALETGDEKALRSLIDNANRIKRIIR